MNSSMTMTERLLMEPTFDEDEDGEEVVEGEGEPVAELVIREEQVFGARFIFQSVNLYYYWEAICKKCHFLSSNEKEKKAILVS